MTKFYYAVNATRAIQSHGRRFIFEALDCHGGSIPGAYQTDNEEEQIALGELTMNPTTGVTEISQEEWENSTKKKALPVPSSSTSKPWNATLPQAALRPTPSKGPAALVAEPVSKASKETGAVGPIKDIAEVIKIGEVQAASTATIGTKLPRPENSKKFNINRERAA